MIISVLFYATYIILCFCLPVFCIFKVNKQIILISALFVAQFNATAFFRAGITIGFFEVSIFLTSAILLVKCKFKLGNFKIEPQDKIFMSFLLFSFLSIIISNYRIFFGDLNPSGEYDTSPFVRSFMSLNKVIIFLPVLVYLRNTIYKKQEVENNQYNFLYILSLSGVIPSVAVIFQALNIGFVLIHNNPSFGEIYHLETYNNIRPVGLSNESSFFAYSLFFSYMGALEIIARDNSKKKVMISVIIFYWIALILTISRTGMLIFLVYSVYKFFSIKSVKLTTIIQFALVAVVGGIILSNITIQNFNLTDRLFSSFDVEADASTIERFGVTEALYRLIFDKCKLLGVGIYDYGYYIKNYLPGYMDLIYYRKGEAPPSFNFILQLIAELGPLLFICMIINMFLILKKSERFVKEWFFFLLLFALSFQVLNFSIPFLILLYPSKNENIVYS